MKPTQVQIKRVRELVAMLRGIPEERVALEAWVQPYVGCDTIACLAGWAAMYPPFVKQGLYLSERSPVPMFKDFKGNQLNRYEALEEFFGIRGGDVFSSRGGANIDSIISELLVEIDEELSDKRLAEIRLLLWLEAAGYKFNRIQYGLPALDEAIDEAVQVVKAIMTT